MADEPDVGVSIGGVYDEAATQKAAAEFEAAVQAMVARIQKTIQTFGVNAAQQILSSKAYAQGVDPKVAEEAFKRVAEAIVAAQAQATQAAEAMAQAEGRVGEAAAQAGEKVTESFQQSTMSAAEFESKVQETVDVIQLMQSGKGKYGYTTENIQEVAKGVAGDPKVLEEAWKRVTAATQGAGEAATQLGAKTTSAIGNVETLTENYRKKIDDIKAAIQDYAQKSKQSYEDIGAALKGQADVADKPLITKAVQELTKESKEAEKAVGGMGGAIGNMGTIAKFVFGTILGVTAVGVIRQLIGWIKEAIQAGEDYLTNLFRLSVAVRAMQRQGMNVGMQDFLKTIDELNQKFPQFSKVALTAGVTNALLFTNNLKLTKEQVDQVISSSVTLAAVMGRDVNEVMRTLALTMSSGYSEGLQRLGININKVVITEKAHAMGMKESYMQMTQNQRAVAALAVVTEQTARMQEDAVKYAQTAPGQLATANAKMAQSTADLGAKLAPFWSRIMDYLSEMLAWVAVIGDAISKSLAKRMQELFSWAAVFSAFFESLNAKITKGADFKETFRTSLKAGLEQMQKELAVFNAKEAVMLPNAAIAQALSGFSEEDQQKVMDTAETIYSELEQIAQDNAEKIEDINNDLARDLEKIELDLARDLEDAEREHQRNLLSIDEKAARDREDAARSLARNLAEDQLKYQQDVADAHAKHLQDEADAEQEYADRVRKLQDRLFFDLEEAIAARDAKAAFRLIRRARFDYREMQTDYAGEKKQRDRDFQRELDEMSRERVIRQQERQREYQQRLQDIAIQAEQERQDEIIRYTRQQEDLKARAEQERKDRLARYEQDLIDQELAMNRQYEKLANSLVKQHKLTADMLKAIYNVYLLYYGPSGAMDKLYNYMIRSAQNAAAQVAAALSGLPTQPTTGDGGTNGHAEGGSFIAAKPVTASFGEKGIELVTATPLTYIGRNTGKLLGGMPGGVSQASQSRILLEVMLSKGLEGQIISAAIDGMSDLLVSVERER